MRRLLTVLAGLALLAGLVVPTAVAGGGSSGKDDREPQRRGAAVTLYSVETATVNISPRGVVNPPENDPASFGAGARFSTVDLLYSDEDRTDRVGRNEISCLFTQVTGNAASGTVTLLCNGVIRLDRKGSLAWQGALSFDADQQPDEDEPFGIVAITGGTGGFRTAGGQIVLFDESTSDTQTLNRYELQLLRLRK